MLFLDCTESDSCASSTERRGRQHNVYYKQINKKAPSNKKTKKKKVAIPVQTPRIPMFGSYVSPPEIPLHYQRMVAPDKSGFNKIKVKKMQIILYNFFRENRRAVGY